MTIFWFIDVPQGPPQTSTKVRYSQVTDQRRAAPPPCSARWFSAAMYAASAETSDGESCAPPSGGITPVCSFGFGTPWVIVRAIAAMLPSPHSHLPFVRSDPSGVPSALDPWLAAASVANGRELGEKVGFSSPVLADCGTGIGPAARPLQHRYLLRDRNLSPHGSASPPS